MRLGNMPTKAQLQFQNNLYDAWLPEWRFYIRAYLGGKKYRDGDYLIKHPLESSTTYARRKEISYYYNYCKQVVDVFVSILYKQKVLRDYGSLKEDPLFKAFLDDADLRDNTYPQFIRELQRWASVYGRVTVIVDKPAMPTETQQDAQDEDIRPYVSLVTPENIIDWGYVKLPNGRLVLDFINIVEVWKGDKPAQIRVWTRNEWAVYRIGGDDKDDVQVTAIDNGVHGLGVVPAVTVYNQNSGTDMIGLSDIEDIAYINKNIYYLCSDAQEIIENTAFPMLAMSSAQGGEEETTVGSNSIVGFDPNDENAKPFWLEPPHGSLAAIEVRIERNIKEIWTIAYLGGIKTAESIQPLSGIAMDIENQQRDASLKEKADNMEQAEEQILSLWALWEDKKFDGEIKYPADFSIRDIDRDLENSLNVLERGKLQTGSMAKEILKGVARNVLSKADAEVLEAVLTEIGGITIDMEKFNGIKQAPATSSAERDSDG